MHSTASENARSNAAFRAAFDELAASSDADDRAGLEAFLGRVVHEIAALLDLPSAVLWEHDLANSTARVRLMVRSGQILPAEASGHVSPVVPLTLDSRAWSEHAARKPSLRAVATDDSLSEVQRTYLASDGVLALVNLPLVVRAESLGAITVRVPRGGEISNEALEAAQSLANHAALALLLDRRAEASRAAAIAVEREQAAKRRNEVLKRANDAMRGAVARLAEKMELQAFLGELLRVIVAELRAVGAGVWLDGNEERRLLLELDDGRVRRAEESAHPGVDVRSETERARDRGEHARGKIIRHGWERIAVDPAYDPHRAYLAARGVRTVIAVPAFLGDRHHANITLRFADDRYLSPEETELALALADQAALAMELTRLSEHEREAAVTRERESAAREQVAELTRANSALARTIDALARDRSIDSFLATTMAAIVEALEVTSMTMWRYEDGFGHLHLVYEEGRAIPAAESTHPNANSPIALEDGVRTEAELTRRKPCIYEVGGHPSWAAEQVAYLRARGVRALIEGVMAVDDRIVGRYTARLLDGQPDPSPARMSLVQALASQAALAIELTRLATEAEQAAVVREREAAARDQVAELTRANTALSRTIDALARDPSIDAFLATTMAAIAEALEVDSMTLWLYQDGFAHLHLVYEGGRATPAAESDHPNAQAPVALTASHWTLLDPDDAPSRLPVVHAVGSDPDWTPEQCAYLRDRGVRGLLEGIMVVDDRVVGVYTARLLDGQPDPPPARRSLVQALASQAALAIELTRLAARARTVAVIEERNRLAREIHDTLAQGLAAIVQQLEASDAVTPGNADPHVTLAMSMARESYVEARRSIRALRPQDLARGSLVEALGHLVRREQARAPARLAFTSNGPEASLPPEVEDELLRIASEALANATKHSGARHIDVDLSFEGAGVRLTVRDDGVGFDVEAARGRGVGLASMRERAGRVGAAVTFASEPDNGAEVIVFWAPLTSRRPT